MIIKQKEIKLKAQIKIKMVNKKKQMIKMIRKKKKKRKKQIKN